MQIVGVYHILVYMQTAQIYSNIYIHQEMVYTSHFPIFSRPKPGGGVYIYTYIYIYIYIHGVARGGR